MAIKSLVINKIKWDRIWIYLYPDSYSEDTSLSIVSMNGETSFELKKCNEEKAYKLNISNPGDCRMLPVGVYKFTDNNGLDALLSDKITARYLNRRFPYFHSEREYRVQFSDKNGFKLKVTDIEIKQTVIQKTKSDLRCFKNDSAKKVLRGIYESEFRLHHRKSDVDVHKLKNPRILLMSDQSEEMGSNMVALKHKLIASGYKPEEALRAITTKHYSLKHWIKTLRKIAWADFIFLDDHSQTTDWLKIKGTIITQLWHAGAGFKSTGYSRFGMPASPAPESGHRQYNYGIAGSMKIRHFFSEVWGINDEMVLPTGMPRLDEFLDPDYKEMTINKILSAHPELCKPSSGGRTLTKKDNIILFAPTYRGENKKNAYYPYDRLDMNRLYKLCKETDSVIIFKMHPFVTYPVPIPKQFRDRMIDMTSYPNINDLFYITDLLITDYSSDIYEFSLMRKPMLFYSFDINDYSKSRGFHRDYRTNVPGKIVENFDAMIEAIQKKDFEYDKVEKYIENNFDNVDTNACQRIIDWIILGKPHP